MSERCPTCGCPVAVVSGGEGTSYYEPTMRSTLEAVEMDNIRLRRDNDTLVRELDRERQVMPSEGVWLVEHHAGGKASMRIAKLGELPDPVAFAAFSRHTQAIAAAIVGVWEGHDESWGCSAMDLAEGIVRKLAEKEGVL